MDARQKMHFSVAQTAEGRLRVSLSFPVVEFDRDQALEIARQMRKIARKLPLAPVPTAPEAPRVVPATMADLKRATT